MFCGRLSRPWSSPPQTGVSSQGFSLGPSSSELPTQARMVSLPSAVPATDSKCREAGGAHRAVSGADDKAGLDVLLIHPAEAQAQILSPARSHHLVLVPVD